MKKDSLAQRMDEREARLRAAGITVHPRGTTSFILPGQNIIPPSTTIKQELKAIKARKAREAAEKKAAEKNSKNTERDQS